MSNTLKNALIALATAGIAVLTALVTDLQACNTTSDPVATDPPPVEQPVDPTPAPTLPVLYAMRGEIIQWTEPAISGCHSVTVPQGMAAQQFDIRKITITIPSAAEFTPGDYDDALVPVDQVCNAKVWIDLEVDRSVAPGEYTVTVDGEDRVIGVFNEEVPLKPTMPIYMGLQSNKLLAAHGYPDHVSYQGPITKKYVDFYRLHRIEPVGQYIYIYPADDLNMWSQYQASFNQLVLDGRIAPPALFTPNPGTPPTSSKLQQIEGWIQSETMPADSWAYAWDEGEGTLDAQALARVQLIKQYAPHLLTMLTRQESSDFLAYTDQFVPVINWFKQPGRVQNYTKSYGLYTSCMAQGNCYNNSSVSQVSPATAFPMMVIEAPEIHARIFPVMVYRLGGDMTLYYTGTKMIRTAWDDQYNEGGNGDGTLLYPLGDDPVASIRLKNLRRGSYDVEYLRVLGKDGSSIVRSSTDWDHDHVALDALRAELWSQQ